MERHCRLCKKFIRVYEERYKNSIRKRGFCVYGLAKADFSLFVSSTYARDCPFFELDEDIKEIFELERKLDGEWTKIRHRAWDGRTKVGRMIRQRYKEKYKDSPAGIFLAEREVLRELYQKFVEEHKEEIEKLNEACNMTEDEYKAFIYSITKRAEFLAYGIDFVRLKAPEGITRELENYPKPWEKAWLYEEV